MHTTRGNRRSILLTPPQGACVVWGRYQRGATCHSDQTDRHQDVYHFAHAYTRRQIRVQPGFKRRVESALNVRRSYPVPDDPCLCHATALTCHNKTTASPRPLRQRTSFLQHSHVVAARKPAGRCLLELLLLLVVGLPLVVVNGLGEVLLQSGRIQGGRPVRLLLQQLVVQRLRELAVPHVQLALPCAESAAFSPPSSGGDISRGPSAAAGDGSVLSRLPEAGWQNGETRCAWSSHVASKVMTCEWWARDFRGFMLF